MASWPGRPRSCPGSQYPRWYSSRGRGRTRPILGARRYRICSQLGRSSALLSRSAMSAGRWGWNKIASRVLASRSFSPRERALAIASSPRSRPDRGAGQRDGPSRGSRGCPGHRRDRAGSPRQRRSALNGAVPSRPGGRMPFRSYCGLEPLPGSPVAMTSSLSLRGGRSLRRVGSSGCLQPQVVPLLRERRGRGGTLVQAGRVRVGQATSAICAAWTRTGRPARRSPGHGRWRSGEPAAAPAALRQGNCSRALQRSGCAPWSAGREIGGPSTPAVRWRAGTESDRQRRPMAQ